MKQLKKHELNFYIGFIAKVEKAKANKKKLMQAAPFIVIVLAAAGMFAYLQLQINSYTGMIAENEVIFDDPENISIADKADICDVQSDLYSSESDALAMFKKIQSSYPINGSEEINKIFACAKNSRISVYSISFDSEGGTAELIGGAASESVIPGFIRELKATELFSSVRYEGYSGSEEGNGAMSYMVTVEMKRKQIYDDSEFEDTDDDYYYYSYDETDYE